jgi:hypothetical protein
VQEEWKQKGKKVGKKAREVQEECKRSARGVQEECKRSARGVQEECKRSQEVQKGAAF